jgi:hypothetical protein
MFADIAPLYSALADLADEAQSILSATTEDPRAQKLARRVYNRTEKLMAALYEATNLEDLDPAQPPAIDDTSILSGLEFLADMPIVLDLSGLDLDDEDYEEACRFPGDR